MPVLYISTKETNRFIHIYCKLKHSIYWEMLRLRVPFSISGGVKVFIHFDQIIWDHFEDVSCSLKKRMVSINLEMITVN